MEAINDHKIPGFIYSNRDIYIYIYIGNDVVVWIIVA